MATTKRPRTAPGSSRPGQPAEGADPSGNTWDWTPGPPIDDTPAGETMPRRAAKLATQNGTRMRDVFAYLLDDDAPAAAPAAPAAPAPTAEKPARKKR